MPSITSSGTTLPKTTTTNPETTTTAKMPGLTSGNAPGHFNKIPGPLGLASASLDGKVALVTGAGTY